MPIGKRYNLMGLDYESLNIPLIDGDFLKLK